MCLRKLEHQFKCQKCLADLMSSSRWHRCMFGMQGMIPMASQACKHTPQDHAIAKLIHAFSSNWSWGWEGLNTIVFNGRFSCVAPLDEQPHTHTAHLRPPAWIWSERLTCSYGFPPAKHSVHISNPCFITAPLTWDVIIDEPRTPRLCEKSLHGIFLV
jgi:hypothetical protein